MKRLSVFETMADLDDLDYEAIPPLENCSVIPFLGHVGLTQQSTPESWEQVVIPLSVAILDARTFVEMGITGEDF
jgi:hypothetical protein